VWSVSGMESDVLVMGTQISLGLVSV
jgi:hypothetical protein